MKKYKVYDEDNKCFIDETKCIFKDGTIYRDDDAYMEQVSDDLTVVWGTGKLDINSEEIFAESSIFEFEYYDIDVSGGWVKGTSSLYFDDEKMSYQISVDGESCNFDKHEITGLKIIGTLQKDKHLLGDNS